MNLCDFSHIEKMADFANELLQLFHSSWKTQSDIDEHQPIHFALASECSSVLEIGVRSWIAAWRNLYRY